MGKDKNTRKNHKQDSQEVSPFPADDNDAALNKQDIMIKTKRKTNNKLEDLKRSPAMSDLLYNVKLGQGYSATS